MRLLTSYCVSVPRDLTRVVFQSCFSPSPQPHSRTILPSSLSIEQICTLLLRHGLGALFLVCNHVTRRPCWGSIQQKFCSKNLHENGVQFPEERNAFVLDHQHGRRDVTCKPAILSNTFFCPQVPLSWSNHFEGPEDPIHWLRALVAKTLALGSWVEKCNSDSLLREVLDLSELFHPDTFLNALRQQTAR